MTVGIYGIFDSKTDECLYIGMSKNIEQRWKYHLKDLKSKKHKRKDFVEWYHANGAIPELLVFRILEECKYDNKTLNTLEIKWFNNMSPKYFGKIPSLNEKWEHSEETRNNIRNTHLQKLSSENNYMLRKLICPGCHEVFHNRIKNRVFCSRKCQAEYVKEKSANEYNYDYIYDLYWNQGLSRPELAEKLGVGRTKALNIMKRLGIPRRTVKESQKLANSKRTPVAKKERIPKISSYKKCSFCEVEFKSSVIDQHEKACESFPKCQTCNVRLSRKGVKFCKEHSMINTKLKCQHCDELMGAMNIKRHEKVCLTYPVCSDCGIRLRYGISKKCPEHKRRKRNS